MSSRDDPTRADVVLAPTRRVGAGPSTMLDVELDAELGERIGQRIGRFEIRDVLGTGGMATVFEARDPTLDRAVALKLLHPDLAVRAERRVLREAQALAKLSHPNVVQVFEAGIAEGRPFIAMELVRGQTLAHWQAVPRGWRELVEVYLQAGRGLAAAHERGLVHRDFKPSNCILDEQGHVRVLDFGLARPIDAVVIDAARASRVSIEDVEPTERRPLDGQSQELGVPGTLGYMPLEQLWGQSLDARSDQFSFCVSLFEGLYGRRPFAGETIDALVGAVLEARLDVPSGPVKVPARLHRLLARGLQARPTARWPGMDELLRALEKLLRTSRRRWRWRLGLGLMAVGTAVWWTSREPACPDPRLELGDTWGPARHARIEATGTAAATEVLPRLDAYADRWTVLRGAVCIAERDELIDAGTADTQRQCLDEARDALEELAVLLHDARGRASSNAAQWIAGLPNLAGCEDPLHFVPVRPLPDDPALVQQVRGLRLQRALAQAAHAEGDTARALTLLDMSLEEATTLGFVPLVAELELTRGNVWIEQGRYDDAEHDLEQAYARAVEHGHPRVALEAAIGLTYVVGDLRENHDAGFKWGLTAEAMARQPWSDPPRLISVMEMMGNVLYEQGRLTAALERYEQAFASRERLEPDSPLEPLTLANIGLVLHEQGRYEDALPTLYEVLAHRRVELEAEHPALAVSLVSLAATLRRLGRHDEALAYLQEALDIREPLLGPDSPGVVIVLNELGHLWLDMGELPRALDAHQRALLYGTRTLRSTHSHVAEAWLGLGRVLQAQGLLDAAARHVTRAVRTYEQAAGPRHPRVGVALSTLGAIEQALGEHEAAREHLELALDILAMAEVPPAELASARFALARTLWSSAGEQQTALTLAEQALDAWVLVGEPAREQATEAEAWLAAHRTG